jgi:hypothetical protein
MPPQQLKIFRNIVTCRTKELGGEVFFCDACREYRYSYHSCQDRHCPKCGNDNADKWLAMQNALLLPVPYFLITFTVPDTLNTLARSNQKIIYNIFFQTAAAALQQLAQDPKYIGGQLGFFGVLQTWTRDLSYHPHLHFIVSGGGISEDGAVWLPAQNKFFVPVRALSKIFRAKFRDALKKRSEICAQVPPETWKKDWVVHCEPVGSGQQALKYLAPYIFRVAMSNRSLLKLENGNVTFRYRDGATKQVRTMTLSAEEFIRRFLQHALPHRFIKVRYYGFLSHRHRQRLLKVKELLGVASSEIESSANITSDASDDGPNHRAIRCPKCSGVMRWLDAIAPTRTRAP